MNASQPVPPKQDLWYTAPAGFETASPGSVLRIRSVPGNLTEVIKTCSAAYNVLFRTVNSLRQPAFAVTTVFIPLSSNGTTTPSSLLSYQIPYNTADLDGSPSYLLYEGGYPDIATALGQGWVVSVPEFEGPLASFLLRLSEGHAVLDSIRSMLSQAKFQLSHNSTRTALWGYSGGSIASSFAVELQPQYVPELTIHGAALGGVVQNFAASVPLINTGSQAGLFPVAFLGLASQSAGARDLLTAAIVQANSSEFLAASNYTLSELSKPFATRDITSYFANYSTFFFSPEIKARDNWYLGFHGVPQAPLFIYKAIQDEVAPVDEVDDRVHRWCSLGGVDIRYERNRVGNHETEYVNGVLRARQFLTSVLDGGDEVVPVNSGCTIQDVAVGVAYLS